MRKLEISPQVPRVSGIGLGTAEFGSAIEESVSFAMMDGYCAKGGNVIDTAHVYADWLPGGRGMSERIVGRWLASSGMRSEVVLGTKGCHPRMDSMHLPRVRPECIHQDLEESLGRLGVERVDIYWLHRDDPTVPVGELLDALWQERAAGRIVESGASNWGPERLAQANLHATHCEERGFCASQIGWCLAQANPTMQGTMGGTVYMDQENEEYLLSHKMLTFAYTSQGAGYFGDRYDVAAANSEKDGKAWFLHQLYHNPANKERRERVRRIANAKGVAPSTLALAWLLYHPIQKVALIGPRDVLQMESSLHAASIHLSPEEFAELDLRTVPLNRNAEESPQ